MSASDEKPEETQQQVVAPEGQEQEEAEGLGICVVTVVTPAGDRVELPALGAADALPFNVKQLLAGYRESCSYSAYLLEYRPPEEGTEAIVLNDFVEIITVAPEIEQTGVLELVMVPQDYTLHDVKVHMKQTYEVIQHPRPLRSAQFPETEEAAVAKKGKAKAAAQEANTSLFSGADDISLKNFFREALYVFSNTAPSSTGGKKGSPAALKSGIRSIAYSGWNPPPPARKLQGDICYIDIDTSSGVYTLTAIASGFFLNRCVHKSTFDPRPANGNCYFSHELVNTILALSPATAAYMQNPPASALSTNEWTMDNMTTQITSGNYNEVFVTPSVSWTAPSSGKSVGQDGASSGYDKSSHEYNASRAMDDYTNVVALDVLAPLTSPAKEWNQELQAIRASMPADPTEIFASTKAVQELKRLNTDFQETASAVAVAILDGHITAINPGESREQQIFIFNNIFFSYAADTKGSFKLCYGDEACRKMYAQDMQNQRYVQATNVPGLNTVLTCLVDYKGFRIVAQSMIPGVLQMGENAARLMYGSIEQGARLKCKTPARELMAGLASALQLAEREVVARPCAAQAVTENDTPLPVIPEQEQNIRLDDLDEVFPVEDETIKHVGPIECKMLQGTDNKSYLLEVARLTPLDPNYVKKASGGTGNVEDEVLDSLDQSMFVTYTLRQELVHLYRIEFTKSAIMKALSDASAGEDAEKAAAASDVIATPSANAEEGVEQGAPATIPAVASSPAPDLKKPAVSSGAENAASVAAAEAMKSIAINPNVFIELAEKADKSEQLLADEELARKMGDFLWSKIIPTITEDIRVMNQIIVDGEAITKYMHEYGINMRYLGRVAEVAREQETNDEDLKKEGKMRINPMPKYWLEVVEMEMIARAVKHIVIKCIRENPGCYLSSTAGLVTDLLCFLLGSPSGIDAVLPSVDESKKASGKKKKSKKQNAAVESIDTSDSALTSSTVPDTVTNAPFDRAQFWTLLQERVKTYFCGSLSLISSSTVAGDTVTKLSPRVARLPLLRRVCQQLGVAVAASDYDFNTLRPISPGDLLAAYPKAKMPSTDIIPYVDELKQRALKYAENGQFGNSAALFHQAGIILEQINGNQCKEMCILNEDFAKMLLQSNQLGSAVTVMERNLVTAIRATGLDSPLTLHQHLIISSVYTELQQYEEAWKHLNAAAYLVNTISGKNHPEASNVLMRMADVATRAGDFANGLVYLSEIRSRFERGGDVIKLAYINQNMAELFEATKALQEAKLYQNAAYQLFRQVFGEKDPRTVDSKEKYAHLLRSNHSHQMNLLQQRQNDEATKKEKERLLWLEDEEDVAAKTEAVVKTAPKKKKSSKKSKK